MCILLCVSKKSYIFVMCSYSLRAINIISNIINTMVKSVLTILNKDYLFRLECSSSTSLLSASAVRQLVNLRWIEFVNRCFENKAQNFRFKLCNGKTLVCIHR